MREDSIKLERGQRTRREWGKGNVKKYAECKSLCRSTAGWLLSKEVEGEAQDWKGKMHERGGP